VVLKECPRWDPSGLEEECHLAVRPMMLGRIRITKDLAQAAVTPQQGSKCDQATMIAWVEATEVAVAKTCCSTRISKDQESVWETSVPIKATSSQDEARTLAINSCEIKDQS
jgi:hypothetical protein